jgi:hypothetical protein
MSPLTESTRLTLAKTWDLAGFDADAAAYIQRVEWADTTPLESATRTAINNFVVGCKTDGTWSAIKASCILAGARTLAGALMPLTGAAPTNFNFVSGDYNRKTGLVGDGITKYLNSNRNNNADPQNSKHLAVYIQTIGAPPCFYINSADSQSRITRRGDVTSALIVRINDAGTPILSGGGDAVGFVGASRSVSTDITVRYSSYPVIVSAASLSPSNSPIYVNLGSGRLAFYSIGESLDLALLDTRVSALITAFGVAIP